MNGLGRFRLLPPLATALALSGCKAEDPSPDEGGAPDGAPDGSAGGASGGSGGGMMTGGGAGGMGLAGGAGGMGGGMMAGGMMAGGAGGMGGSMMTGGAGGMMAGGAGGMMTGGAGGMGGGMMADGAGGAGGMGMTGDPCNGCVELSLTYPDGGPRVEDGTTDQSNPTNKQADFQVNFDPPLDLTGATATIRVMVTEANPDAFVQFFVQNGAPSFAGSFSGFTVLSADNFAPGEFADVVVPAEGGGADPTAIASVGIQLGGIDDRAAGGTAIAYVDSITFDNGLPAIEFTADEEGMFVNPYQSPPDSAFVHLP